MKCSPQAGGPVELPVYSQRADINKWRQRNTTPKVFSCSFVQGVLLGEAEGQRERHAESEAGGHPQGLRQTVSNFWKTTRPSRSHRRPLILLLISPCVDLHALPLRGKCVKSYPVTSSQNEL